MWRKNSNDAHGYNIKLATTSCTWTHTIANMVKVDTKHMYIDLARALFIVAAAELSKTTA